MRRICAAGGTMLRRGGLFFLRALAWFAVFSALAVFSLRWFNPPASAFMLAHLLGEWWRGSGEVYVYHHWTAWDRVAPAVPLAIMAAEDQRFPQHHGFDWVEIENAIATYQTTGKLRGASTVSQQVAKNLFLWAGKNLLRKALEGWFTLLLESSLPKRRILEIYINVAQFSPDTFGIGAAARRYFGKPPALLSWREASLLAAVLPNPRRFRIDAPSAPLGRRAKRIEQQMRQLGAGYLQRL